MINNIRAGAFWLQYNQLYNENKWYCTTLSKVHMANGVHYGGNYNMVWFRSFLLISNYTDFFDSSLLMSG